MTARWSAGRPKGPVRGHGCRLIATLATVFATPAALAGVQQQAPSRVMVVVHVISEAGGAVPGAYLLIAPNPLPDDTDQGITRMNAPTGTAALELRVERAYRIVARGQGHRERVLDVSPSRAQTLRIVLAVDPYELPPIMATAEGGGASSSARSVHQIRFARESLTYATVAEWLIDVPGVSVRSGPGGRQVLSVRGSRPEDVLVLLDGVPLNDPLTGRADLSALPTSTLESGTLVSGAATQRFGPGASAGVLLLTSRAGVGRGVGGALRLGSFGGMGFDIQADAAGENRRLGVSVSAQRAENDFAFRSPLVPGGSTQVRRNADAASVSAAVEASTGPARASLRYDRSERGVPGRVGTSLFESARADDGAWIAAAGINTSRARASASYGMRHIGYRPSPADPGSVHYVRELRLSSDVDLPSMPVTVGGRLTRETVGGDLIEGSPGRAVAGARISAALVAGRLRLDPAAALDISSGLTAVSPELAATWLASPRTRVWGRLGRGLRLPTFGDLYFASQYQLRPNPELGPERVTFDSETGVSTGVSLGSAQFQASATAWYRRTRDPIVWLPSSVSVWSPANLGELRATGLELFVEIAASADGESGWRAQLAATVQRSRVGFGSNRNPLPYEPRNSGRVSLEAWSGSLGGRVDLRRTGARTTSLAATRTLNGFTTVDVAARHQFGAGRLDVGLFLRVENILDRRYELVELFPQPGRHFTVRLEARRART